MAQGVLEELAVQQIILCDKTDGGRNGGDLHTAFDYVQKTTGGFGSDSDCLPDEQHTGEDLQMRVGGKQVAFEM